MVFGGSSVTSANARARERKKGAERRNSFKKALGSAMRGSARSSRVEGVGGAAQ